MLTYCYQRNHSKQILKTTARKIIANSTYKVLTENYSKQYLKTITKEIIANYAFKRLSHNSIHLKQHFLFIANNTQFFQNFYQKIHYKKCFQVLSESCNK